MYLGTTELEQVRTRLEMAFPLYKAWRYVNEKDSDHRGFTIWGSFTLTGRVPKTYFLTFDKSSSGWAGTFSIGKHCYYWSSADFGDAILLTTDRRETLDDAIAALKSECAEVFAGLLGRGPKP